MLQIARVILFNRVPYYIHVLSRSHRLTQPTDGDEWSCLALEDHMTKISHPQPFITASCSSPKVKARHISIVSHQRVINYLSQKIEAPYESIKFNRTQWLCVCHTTWHHSTKNGLASRIHVHACLMHKILTPHPDTRVGVWERGVLSCIRIIMRHILDSS